MPPHYRIHAPGQLHEGSWAPPGVGAASGGRPYRGGYAAEQHRQLEIRKYLEKQKDGDAPSRHSQMLDASSISTDLALINIPDGDVRMELARDQPFACHTPPQNVSATYHAVMGAALSGDMLSMICNLVGLKHFDRMALVDCMPPPSSQCTAWHDAIKTKMREWGVLTYLRTLGRGFGKLRGQFDTPTWMSLLPDGQLAIVDSCNYRLQILQPSTGLVTKVVGRPGARHGQLSSPSSIAYSSLCGPTRVFASSSVGPEDRRVMAFDFKSWNMVESTPEGTGKTELDAPEGMTIADGKVFVVDTANHRIVAFDKDTLEKIETYPPLWWARTGRQRQGKHWDQLNCPQDIVSHEGELFVSDTHNDRIQVFSTALSWIGVIGCRGYAAGEFVYPRGVAIAGGRAKLLYVCEETRIQALTLLGEPRIVLPVPGAVGLCGIVSDGTSRVYCSDMDAHVIHVMRLTHGERWQEKRREAIAEAKARRALLANDDGYEPCGTVSHQDAERYEKQQQRDRAVTAVLTSTSVRAMLGLPETANEAQIRQAVRLAMRLLHPDRTMNLSLKGTRQFDRLEAAFKRVNNLKDVERIDHWLHD